MLKVNPVLNVYNTYRESTKQWTWGASGHIIPWEYKISKRLNNTIEQQFL